MAEIDTDLPTAFGLDQHMIDSLAQRINARFTREESMPSLTLPESKEAFPKLLCLDLNKWIDLARAHYGQTEGTHFKPALEAINGAVDRGRLLVPVTGANAAEAVVPRNEGRRRRLAEFMVSLSRNHSLVSDTELATPEYMNAFCRLYLRDDAGWPIRSRLIQRGMHFAIIGRRVDVEGVGESANTFFKELLGEPEVSVGLLMHWLDRDQVLEAKRDNEETAKMSTVQRGHDPTRTPGERRRVGIASLFKGGAGAAHVRAMFDSFHGNPAMFTKWLAQEVNAEQFGGAIPGVDVFATLVAYRDQNPQYAASPNDVNDFRLFRIAIPYANVLVAERSWGSIAKAGDLDRKYKTTIMSDLKQLPEILSSEGCS